MYAMTVVGKGQLAKTEVPEPVRKKGEVLIDVAAAGVNRADLMQADGTYPSPEGWPQWPGLEASGRILEADEGSRFRPGDTVCALLGGGGYAERVAVPEVMAMAVPDGMPIEMAGGVPEVFATAWLDIVREAKLQAGETIFVSAGASGLGLAAIQIAKMIGAKVVTTVGSDEKGAFVKGMGADVVINRHKDDLGSALDANPPDVALDCVGGYAMGANFAKMKPWGRWVRVASMAGGPTVIPLDTVFRKRLRLIGSTLRSRTDEEKGSILHDIETKLLPRFADGSMKVVVHAIFPLWEAQTAHGVLRRNENTGKVLLAFHSHSRLENGRRMPVIRPRYRKS